MTEWEFVKIKRIHDNKSFPYGMVYKRRYTVDFVDVKDLEIMAFGC